ncbi:MAG: glycine cleavage system protein GcvH [Candidatus Margulisbacteria bacterium]|nr:glycine cleavage system protein GcvH [Candidatus Margulisiibacteriota bacterium]MBU1021969.1 glycine cleavage system protein GcvH [Candidatus Margulisiibacteriota bacterium]MBU1728948.1 glycine cleavage system protein GcvH [Candidatus Margulisiibacteriota bacterium]MBU1954754.1 glycine cleavage system protein GcvH [Candidatus Margulisiibacteriota bacterium]
MAPAGLKYSKDHEWVKADGKIATVGITAYAQDQLGDVVFVELPQVGTVFAAGKDFGVVESVKTVSTLYCPVSGKVVEINSALEGTPDKVNSSPYEEGWMIKIEMDNPAELDKLLDEKQYTDLLKG